MSKTLVVRSRKQLHGWTHALEPLGRRECTDERLLINPYHGCSHGCFFCYARTFWSHGDQLVVAENFDREVARQLDGLAVASCGYLSPVTDPFQPLERAFHLSEGIAQVFSERNLPLEFVTKGRVPQPIIEILRHQPHSFGQVSLLTPDPDLHRRLVPGGAGLDELFGNLERLREAGMFAVARIDPVLPFLTDNLEALEELVSRAVTCGARHIVASCLDIPLRLKARIMENYRQFDSALPERLAELYRERIGAYLHAGLNYRRRLFGLLGELCRRHRVTFALCMEFALTGRSVEGHPVVEGLNRSFMTSRSCEGVEIPLYVRDGARFRPLAGCAGVCLSCDGSGCAIPDLPRGGAWRLKDYRRWSRMRENVARAGMEIRLPFRRAESSAGRTGGEAMR